MRLLIRRFPYHLSLWLGIVVFSFVLFYVIPTDPVRTRLGPYAPAAQVEALRRQLGLDRPLYVQVLRYVVQAVRMDFGRSLVDGRPVAPEVGRRLQATLALLATTGLVTLVYLTLAAFLEVRHRSRWMDGLDFLWVSTPTMFSGILVALLVTRLGLGGPADPWRNPSTLLPPALVLALYPMVVLSRILRDELRRIEASPFIRTARALGLPETWVVGRYMLRNALVPLLAAVSNQVPVLFTGAFIVEVIFSVPGVGSLLLRSLLERDLPMMEGIVVLNGAVVVLSHLTAEVLSGLADPRTREGHE